MIQTQAQWDLERASLIGSCGELNCELLQNAGHFGPGLIFPGLFLPNLGVGRFCLGRWVISANFQSGSFRSLVVLAKF